MSLPTSLYVPGDSWLHRLDPRVKLAFALLITILALSLNSLLLFLVLLILCHLVLLSAGIPTARIGWAWRLMLPVVILIPLLWPIFSPAIGPVLLRLGPVTLTALDIWQGLAMAARVLTMAFAFFVWLFTTDETEMVLGFVALGLPFEWGLTLAITLRYVPALQTTFQQVMDAQRARGLVIPRRNPLRAARAYVPALVPMLILALRSADSLSRALEARAFGAPDRRRSQRRRLHLTTPDWLALTLLLVFFFALLATRLFLGWGRDPVW